MRPPPPPPSECANCGAAIPRRARACPACGADERTGWREASIYDGLDLPDSADDSAPADPPAPFAAPRGSLPWYWIAAVLVLLLLALGVLSLL